ncbi:MAG: polysaccharide pyruvyl transferase CsaB [Thermanaerothrix sp.]|nr:polysaccharide pyruvyl transferase CsaB [Thermanaerothrix sp.]
MAEERELQVVLCGYYGFGNLGDELLARGLVELLEGCGIPRSRIGVLSAAPAVTAAELSVKAEDRWSPRKVFGFLRSAKTLLLGGGGLFQDVTSIKSPIYYSGVVWLAKRAGAVPWAFGQSLGPLRSALGRTLAAKALGACKVRVFRDRRSVAMAQSIGLGAAALAPDPVMALRPSLIRSKEELLLVNLRPSKTFNLPGLARSIMRLAHRTGLSPAGFAMAEEDLIPLRDLEALGVRWSQVRLLRNLKDFEEMASCAGGSVSMRLHGVVLSALSGLPCAALPYDPKVESFADAFGIPKHTGEGEIILGEGLTSEVLNESARALREAMEAALSKLGLVGGGGAC